ncbi:MAG: AraC family transcriptional regulator N-terminal domain-containing protein [Methylovirgula sp.]
MSNPLKEAIEDYIAAHGGGDGAYPTEIGALTLMCSTTEALPNPMIYRPALCVIVQGAKQILFGERLFDYAAMQCLVISLTLPAFGRVARASPEKPLLALNLDFDLGILQEVMVALERPPVASTGADFGVFVGNLDAPLADCLLRLVRLLATPPTIRVLYPAIMREIYYWLLTGPHGGDVCKLALPNSHTQRVARAIHLLREHYTSAIRVEDLAAAAGMSASSFHEHFKALTSMTPLQYQKQLRLLEARRLLVADGANVAHAAYRVGYESASQFSREYARMFGQPPKRDAMELKAHPAPA